MMRLMSIKDPVNDESLGVGGLYDNGMTIQQACLVSKPPKPALLFFLLTRAIKPSYVIELGILMLGFHLLTLVQPRSSMGRTVRLLLSVHLPTVNGWLRKFIAIWVLTIFPLLKAFSRIP